MFKCVCLGTRCVTGWTDWDFFGVFTVFIVFFRCCHSNMVTITSSKHEYARAVIISVLKLQLQLKAEANLIKKNCLHYSFHKISELMDSIKTT